MDEYLESIVRIAPVLRQAAADCVKEWAPDAPPITILYAALGRAIAHSLTDLDPNTCVNLFVRIKFGMAGSDSAIGDAVATGLLEALATHTFKDPLRFEEVLQLAQPRSKSYIKCYVFGHD